MNNTTAQLVKQYIDNNPLLKEYLFQGLINYSALSRLLLPKIKKENPKARIESILIAIQRSNTGINQNMIKNIQNILIKTEISLTSDIMQIVFERTNKIEKEIYNKISKRKDTGLCVINENRKEISLFISKHYLQLFQDIIKHKISLKNNLAVVGLYETEMHIKKNSLKVTGYISHICSIIAQKGINIVEINSCNSYILIFVEKSQATLLYETLSNHKSNLNYMIN